MEHLRLPVLPDDATLNEALEALKHHRCSALVVDRPSGAVVLDVALILSELWQRGNVALSTIEPGLRLEPTRRLRAFRSEEIGERVVLAERLPEGEAVVLTTRETYTYFGAAPRLFGCPKDRDETWVAHQLIQPGNLCRNHKEPTFPIT